MKFILVILSVFILSNVFAQSKDTITLKPKPSYGREVKAIMYLLDHYHYRKLSLNDSLSEAILKQYIHDLDNNRSYFLASDIESFNKYKDVIDDLTKKEDVSVAYEIYSVFIKRYKERMDYVLNTLIGQQYDFTIHETYEADHEDKPWAATVNELNESWRKLIKNQELSLKLSGKKQQEITDILRKRYERAQKSFNQFRTEDVFSLYMNSITESYDPHTSYFSPKAAELFKQSMSLSLEGIGASLQTENDFTKVVRVLPGGDADKSGKLHANDYIVGVAQGKEGEMVDVIGWRLDEVVKLIKGPKGTFVRLNILPSETGISGPQKEITLVRDKIKLEDQAAKKNLIRFNADGKEVKLGVITLPSFYMDFDGYQKGNPDYRSTTRDVKKLINELKDENINGLVMDLRNNGGGSLSEVIDLTGLFIKDGPVVQVRSSNNQIQTGEDHKKDILYAGPLVVLTNRFSASASEIFAGAIQDYHRGVIIGESTYGKGTVQRVQELSQLISENAEPVTLPQGQNSIKIINEKAEPVGDLSYTFQKFYRISGSSTQHKGVEPDVKLPTALNPEQYGESSSRSALPWDEIKSANYQLCTDVTDKIIAGLNKSYHHRLKHDAKLKNYVIETEELRNNIQQKSISLNEAVRKKQMDESDKKKAKEKLDTKITSTKEDLPQDDIQKMKDEYLREALLILSELVTRKVG